MAAATTQAPKQIDLKNPDLYVQAVPHDLFAWLRVNDPVHWNREEDGAGVDADEGDEGSAGGFDPMSDLATVRWLTLTLTLTE